MSDNSRKILVVDDDRDIRLLMNFILSRAGYTVVQAVNGAEALERIKESTLDLIISDVKMPVMDGYELIRQLRRMPEKTDIPVLLLTGSEQVRISPEDIEYPADDYLSKPFNAGDLLPKVEKLLASGK